METQFWRGTRELVNKARLAVVEAGEKTVSVSTRSTWDIRTFLQGGSEKSQIGGSPGGPDDEFPPSSQEPVAVVTPFGSSKWVTCPARFMSVSF